MLTTLLSFSVFTGCLWVYPQNPATTPPECRVYAKLPAHMSLVDEAYGITLEESVRASTFEQLPQIFKRNPEIDRPFQVWSVRNVAYHLRRVFDFTNDELKRNVQWRKLQVIMGREATAVSEPLKGTIRIAGTYALMSEVIYHELAHHIVEWENPGLLAARSRYGKNIVGESILEAYANHFAFVLDDEPRYAEYNQMRYGGDSMYSYRVDTPCSLASCEDLAPQARPYLLHVVAFGSLLWDLKEKIGGIDSLNLMLDSVRLLDVKSPLTHRAAVVALLKVDQKKFGGRNAGFIKARARARLGES